nr:chaperonin subunit Cct4 [Schizosaccharomyces pombe]
MSKAATVPVAFQDREKPQEVRLSNIMAARSVADAIRTSLGPKGMDKMIQTGKGEVILTNDGATILKHLSVLHPAAKMRVDLSAAQDVEAGDGTTSVVILAGSMLACAEKLLKKGIHPTVIAESFQRAAGFTVDCMKENALAIELSDRESLLRAATTSLNSKIVSQYSNLLAPIAVDAVLKVIDPRVATNVDLKDIRIVKKLGGIIDDTELIPGLALTQTAVKSAGPTRIEKANIALIQFQLSPPKPDMENQVVVNDYRQMDKILKEERQYLLNMCKKIKKAGANVILIQKSILRDAVNDLALHFLAKLKIMVIKEVIERDEVEFICKSTGCKPIADIESFAEDKLGHADLVEETSSSGEKIVKFSGVKNAGKTVSILCRGANLLTLEEAERSLHDALCVIRCLVKQRALIAGGGSPEIEAAQRLLEHARQLEGREAICIGAFSEALEIIPVTLAENAGLNAIRIVTELRKSYLREDCGYNVRKGIVTNILEENVLQPLLVNISAIQLAAETTKMIMKIDDITLAR